MSLQIFDLANANLHLRRVVAIRIPYAAQVEYALYRKRNGFPRRFAQRDGGIPRFIDLPPSPFRGNDRGVLYIALYFPYWHFLSTGDPSDAPRQMGYIQSVLNIHITCHMQAGRHRGRPLQKTSPSAPIWRRYAYPIPPALIIS